MPKGSLQQNTRSFRLISPNFGNFHRSWSQSLFLQTKGEKSALTEKNDEILSLRKQLVEARQAFAAAAVKSSSSSDEQSVKAS